MESATDSYLEDTCFCTKSFKLSELEKGVFAKLKPYEKSVENSKLGKMCPTPLLFTCVVNRKGLQHGGFWDGNKRVTSLDRKPFISTALKPTNEWTPSHFYTPWAHNCQNEKVDSLHACPCHKMHRVEANGLFFPIRPILLKYFREYVKFGAISRNLFANLMTQIILCLELETSSDF